jgi:hypothetical protein
MSCTTLDEALHAEAKALFNECGLEEERQKLLFR